MRSVHPVRASDQLGIQEAGSSSPARATLTGFAHDMINAGNQWVFDTANVGILNATVNAAVTTWNSIGGRIGQAVQALLDWGAAQLENLFGIGYQAQHY